jgi:hypothetical protein
VAFRGIQSRDVLSEWKNVEPRIRQALDVEDTGYATEDILTCLQTRDMQLWVHPHAVAVTQIQVLPQFKKLLLVTLGGENMDKWIQELMDLLRLFGMDNDCKYLEQQGRKSRVSSNEG